MKLRVLSLRNEEDREVGVGGFPEREEILIGRLGFCGVALHGVSTSKLEVSRRADGFVHREPGVVEDLLELGGGFFALMGGQIGFAAHVDGT